MADNRLDVQGNFRDNISPALKQIESGIIRVVGAFSAMATAMATLAAPITQAAEFQKQMLEVQKTTDYTATAISYLGRELVDLSKTINVTASDLAKIAALGGQLGIGDSGAKALLSFTEEIARAVTALDVDAELAATSLGKLINIFNIDPGKYRNVIGVINQISNVSTAKPEELFDILRRIGNLGGSVTIDQATALSAVMIDLGLTAETAGTSMTKIFADMKSSAGDFANFVGLSTDQWSQKVEQDGVGALKLYLQTLNSMPSALAASTKAQLTGEGRIFGLVTKLQEEMAKGGGLLDRRLNAAAAELQVGTSAMKEQQNVLSGLSAQWQVLKNNVSALSISAGGQALEPLTKAVRSLALFFGDQKNIDAFASTAKSMVDAISLVASTITSAIGAISALGVNWGRLLDAAGMLALAKGMQLVFRGMSALGSLTLGAFSGKQSRDSTADAERTAGAWTKAAAMVSRVGARHEANAIAARVSAADQIASAARVASAQRALQVESAARTVSQQSSAYYARWVQPLVTKTIAGTVTAQEAAQLRVRLANYQAMSANMNAILTGRVTTEAAAQAAITTTQNVEVRRRLSAYLFALQTERNAEFALARERATQSQAQAAGILQAGPKAPGVFGRLSASFTEISRSGLPAFLARAGGYADAYAVSATRAARASLALAGGMALIGRAASFVLSRLLGWVSIGIIFVEIGAAALEFLGVLDKVKDGIWSVLKIFGVKSRPEFLSNKSIEEEKAKQLKAYDEIIASKQKFEQQFGTVKVAIALNADDAAAFDVALAKVKKAMEGARVPIVAKMRFSIEAPLDASKAVIDSVATVDKLAAGVAGATAEYDKMAAAAQDAASSLMKAEADLQNLMLKGAAPEKVQAQITLIEELQAKSKASDEARYRGSLVLSATTTALNKQLVDTISFFDKTAATDLFVTAVRGGKSLVESLQDIGTRQDEITEKAKELAGITDITADLSGAGIPKGVVEEVRKLKDEYIALGKEKDALVGDTVSNADIQKFFPTADSLAKFLAVAAQSGSQLSRVAKEAGASIGGLAAAAKGLGAINLPVGASVDQFAGTIAVALAAKKAYSEMASIAKKTSEDAKQSVARALDKNKQDYKEFTDFLVRTGRNIDAQADKGRTQVRTRAVDDGLSARQDGMSAVRSLENDILNTIKEEGRVNQQDIVERLQGLEQAAMYGRDELARLLYAGKITKETYDTELRALTDTTLMQRDVLSYYYERGNMTKEEAAAIQRVIGLKYKAADRKIVDDAEAQKAAIGIDTISSSFGRLKTEAEQSRVKLAEIDRELSKDSVSTERKVALLEQRNRVQEELAASLGLMRGEAEKLSAVDPVGGKTVIDVTQVAAMESAIQKLTDAQASLRVSTAGPEANIWTQYANQLSGVSQAYETMAINAQRAANVVGVSGEQLTKLVALSAQLPTIAAEIAKFQDTLSQSAAGRVAPIDAKQLIEATNAAISSISKDQLAGMPPIDVQAKLSDSSVKEIRAGMQALGDGLKDALGVTAADSLQKGADDLNTRGGIKLKTELDVTKVSSSNGALNQYGGAMAADGGPVIVRNADGGPIRGRGTGRSDSILSWLSHGEHVMDSTTVRMFGSGFFSTLQAMAQRGMGLEGLRSYMSGFASGGPVMLPGMEPLSASGILQSISNGDAGGDTMNLDISFNGQKRSRLRGRRDQVESFAEAVRELQKGMA